jgi:hypothetical protein
MLPGGGSFQSAKVRILMRRRAAGSARRSLLARVAFLGVRNKRSMVAALMDRILGRIVSSSFTCPLRSSAGNKMGKRAFKRLPQTRSDASHNTIRPARAASS